MQLPGCLVNHGLAALACRSKASQSGVLYTGQQGSRTSQGAVPPSPITQPTTSARVDTLTGDAMTSDSKARRLLLAERRTAGWFLHGALETEERRELVRQHMAATGVTFHGMARTLGIARRTLVAFMEGGELSDRARARVNDWCEGKQLPLVRPEMVAVAVLCTWFPLRHMKAARTELWGFVKEMYASRNERIPGFVTDGMDPLLPSPR